MSGAASMSHKERMGEYISRRLGKPDFDLLVSRMPRRCRRIGNRYMWARIMVAGGYARYYAEQRKKRGKIHPRFKAGYPLYNNGTTKCRRSSNVY